MEGEDELLALRRRRRARLGGFGIHDVAGGLVVWLATTWAHIPLAGWAAGVWRWIY